MTSNSNLAAFLVATLCVTGNATRCAFADDATTPADLDAVQQAKSLVEAGHSDAAIIILDAAISQHSNSGILFLTRAVLQQGARRDRNAIDDFSRAIEFGFQPAACFASRGLSRLNIGDRNGAIKDFNLAIKTDPNLAIAYLLRGRTYYEDGHHLIALQDFNAAIRLDPSAEAYIARAVCHMRIGEHAAACADATSAAKIDPFDPSPIYIRMSAHLERGDNDAALVDYKLAQRLEANAKR